MACLEWLAMADVDFGLTFPQHPYSYRVSWIRQDSFSKKARRKKEEEKIKI
jgi:hypothetical protein